MKKRPSLHLAYGRCGVKEGLGDQKFTMTKDEKKAFNDFMIEHHKKMARLIKRGTV